VSSGAGRAQSEETLGPLPALTQPADDFHSAAYATRSTASPASSAPLESPIRAIEIDRPGRGGQLAILRSIRRTREHRARLYPAPSVGRHKLPSAAIIAVDAAHVELGLRRTAVRAGVRRRFAPHQLRHAHAVELAREGVPLIVIQRQLGHSNLGITSVYLQGIDNAEIIETVHARRQPMIPITTSLPRQ
jgi:hypothetical protein